MDTVLNDLLKAGLIQYGNFKQDDSYQRIKLMLELMPSYPKLLLQLANIMSQGVSFHDFDYVLASHDAIALGSMISQITQIPLVYEKVHATHPVERLIGSYDVGHPTLLICNITDTQESLLSDASKVGLIVTKVRCIVSTNKKSIPVDIETLFTLSNILENAPNYH